MGRPFRIRPSCDHLALHLALPNRFFTRGSVHSYYPRSFKSILLCNLNRSAAHALFPFPFGYGSLPLLFAVLVWDFQMDLRADAKKGTPTQGRGKMSARAADRFKVQSKIEPQEWDTVLCTGP